MLTTTISHRYARALFEASREDGITSRVAADLASLRQLHLEDSAFHVFLISPEVLTETKVEFVKSVFGPRVAPLTLRFLLLLIDKGRIDHLTEVCEDFRRLHEESRGLLRAEVFTAMPLEGEQEARLKRELDHLTGKSVILEKKLDREILGGVVVHLGNRIIDRSLRRGLKELGDRLRAIEVA
jgi:F-type H+-transporting ATPase subunit delta